jgi:tRNA modification GTPase
MASAEETDTIFALATAPGRAAVAIVRISGRGAGGVLSSMGARCPRPRAAALRTLRDGGGEILDHALVIWFPGPSSYTGEDVVELQIHGGSAVVESVLRATAAAGARLAGPGEFTRRAFANGRLDLDQAEAVGDLIDAQTDAQSRQALAQLNGALGRRYEAWRGRLVGILGVLEAAVDFPDEELPRELELRAREPLEGLVAELEAALGDGGRGRRVREGYRVAIVGAPNAGKSSLLNGLAGREAAIVTPVAGATRDIIEAPVLVAGYAVILADMAGLRVTGDPVEAEGVRRARAWAGEADLRLWVVDGAGEDDGWRLAAAVARAGDLCILNKADLPRSAAGKAAAAAAAAEGLETLTAAIAMEGVERIRRWLSERVIHALGGADFPATTRERHAAQLVAARDHLRRASMVVASPELAAEDVRLAARSLALVTGAIGVEDVLDEVFATFCIGK